PRIRRRETRSGQLRPTRNPIDNALAFDGHSKGPTNETVIERGPGHIHTIKISAKIWIDAQELGVFATVAVDAVDRHGIGDVQLSGTKGAFLDVVAVDRVKNNFV